MKALLRKRFGSVRAFEDQKGLKRHSVSDVLRGRTSAAVQRVIEAERPEKSKKRSDKSDNSASPNPPHRLNAEAR